MRASRVHDEAPDASASRTLPEPRSADAPLHRLELSTLPSAGCGTGGRAAERAAASTGALAAALLARAAGLSALRGPDGFRQRARSIASRAADLRSALSTAARAPATSSGLDVAARCAQLTTLAAEVARDGHGPVRLAAAAASRLGASAAESALARTEEDLGSAAETDGARSMKRRIWRIRLLLNRAHPAAVPVVERE